MKKLFASREAFFKLIVCGGALLLAGLALVLYLTVLRPEPKSGSKLVTLEIVYQNKTYSYERLITSESYVLGFLLEYNEELQLGLEYSSDPLFGAFVTGLKGTKQNTELGHYYTYTINGEFSDGVSTQVISDGDEIRFCYSFEVWEENENGEWVCTSTEILPGGDDSPLGISQKYDMVLIGLLSLIVLLVLASGAYLTISTLKTKKSN